MPTNLFEFADLTTLVQEHKVVIGWLAVLSGLLFVGSILAVPSLVIRIPEDYFASRQRPKTRFANEHPMLRWTVWGGRNVLGVALILAGLAMLLLPGQGLLTILVGILLMDFPGKHRLERRIVRTGPVLKSINWVRRQAHVRPLRLDDEEEEKG